LNVRILIFRKIQPFVNFRWGQIPGKWYCWASIQSETPMRKRIGVFKGISYGVFYGTVIPVFGDKLNREGLNRF